MASCSGLNLFCGDDLDPMQPYGEVLETTVRVSPSRFRIHPAASKIDFASSDGTSPSPAPARSTGEPAGLERLSSSYLAPYRAELNDMPTTPTR